MLDEPAFRQRAEAIAPQMRAGQGVERATDILAGHFGFTRAESAETAPAR